MRLNLNKIDSLNVDVSKELVVNGCGNDLSFCTASCKGTQSRLFVSLCMLSDVSPSLRLRD